MKRDDLISRQAVLTTLKKFKEENKKALKKMKHKSDKDWWNGAINTTSNIMELIKYLPLSPLEEKKK